MTQMRRTIESPDEIRNDVEHMLDSLKRDARTERAEIRDPRDLAEFDAGLMDAENAIRAIGAAMLRMSKAVLSAQSKSEADAGFNGA